MRSSTSTAPKRSRASPEQLDALVDYMLEKPELGSALYQKVHGKHEYEREWDELTVMLNNHAGPVKTVDQWHVVWRDLKSRTAIKARRYRKQLAANGEKSDYYRLLTDLERRILKVIGDRYVQARESSAENEPVKRERQRRLSENDESLDYTRSMCSNTTAVGGQTQSKVFKRKQTDDDGSDFSQIEFLNMVEEDIDHTATEKKPCVEEKWSASERACLRKFITPYIGIIDYNEDTDEVNKDKDDAWKDIRAYMLAAGYVRDVAALKRQWTRMKLATKSGFRAKHKPTASTAIKTTYLQSAAASSTLADPISVRSSETQSNEIISLQTDLLRRQIRHQQTLEANEKELHLLRIQLLKHQIANAKRVNNQLNSEFSSGNSFDIKTLLEEESEVLRRK